VNLQPVTLEGDVTRLEPLAPAHFAPLCEIGLDPEIWRWMINDVRSPEDLRRYLERALQEQREGKSLPFATVERASGKVVGSTRFGNIDPPNRRVEIGWTWIARPWQRMAINTEAKYLMLRYAFEIWGCVRVELKTNAMNYRSRAAILRIGAKEEGTLRKHQISERGVSRDTVYFSILDTEWPRVKAGIEERMRRRPAPA
jgi:N-acetyltransferase